MALPLVAVIGPNDSRTQAVVQRYNMLAGQDGGSVEVLWIDNASGDDVVLEQAKEAIAVIPAGPRAITTELALKLPNLRLIQTTSAGTDYLDKTALGESGVLVANNGGGNSVAVAEHAVALMISVYRKMNLQLTSTRAGTWMAGVTGGEGEYHNLVDKTVGIVGLGRIGSSRPREGRPRARSGEWIPRASCIAARRLYSHRLFQSCSTRPRTAAARPGRSERLRIEIRVHAPGRRVGASRVSGLLPPRRR